MRIDEMFGHAAAGRPPAAIYQDPDVHRAERDHLFGRTWQFLAHVSEVPDPGDYVVRRILDDSFIVARGSDGAIRVLLNVCVHKGMQVCRSEAGRATHFRCPYHAWTYSNTGELVGVPFHLDAYGGDAGLRRTDRGLVQPRFEEHRGMVFACVDPDAPPLADYLGAYRFYLDFYLHQSDAGAVVRGPQRWIVKANWKIGAENFAGDSYHTPHTHASIVDIGLFREPKANKRKEGATYQAGVGSGTTYKLPTADFGANLAHVGYPPEMVSRMRDAWAPAQQAMIAPAGFMVSASTLFPNLSLVHNWPQVDGAGLVVPFISLRLWQPLGPDETEVLSWFVVDAAAPQWFQDASYRAYLLCFGSSGMFEQDDVENWTSITSMARGHLTRRLLLDCTMGSVAPGGGEPEAIPWPGPGRAHVGFSEHCQRAFLRRWAAYCAGGPAPGPEAARSGGAPAPAAGRAGPTGAEPAALTESRSR